MSNTNTIDTQGTWESFCASELLTIQPLLLELGFTLEKNQPHTQGERFLMHAVTSESGKKLILIGRRISDNLRVIIKITRDPHGIRELVHERTCRTVLTQIRFAYDVFFAPTEILFTEKDGYTISIHEFISQEKTFLERPLKEQFSLAIKAFKSQEGAHATTHAHIRLVQKSFTSAHADFYLNTFRNFCSSIQKAHPENIRLSMLLTHATEILENNREIIEQYSGFLTHIDFVPHNFRIVGDTIYLLDHSSLRFGNKYEGWARFLNFMVLYNKPLEEALMAYVKENRTPEESLSLYLMRLYRLGEIIWYYTRTLTSSEGNLRELNQKRIIFWTEVLTATSKHESVSEDIISSYKTSRDALRGADEKKRQIGLH